MFTSNSQSINPKRVIILGSAGVVGKKLVPYLKQKGIDTLPLSRQNCDLLEEKSVDFLTEIFQPSDQIVLLTAITPDKGRGTKALIDNLYIIENVYKALQKCPVTQFILFSSEAIYPTTSDIINEKTSLTPTDLYGCMHLAREIHLCSLKIPLAIIRPALIYGYGDTHNSYGPNRFLKEALQQGTITLFGKGEEKRSHIFVKDVVKFVDKVLHYQSTGTINLCPSPTISFMEVAQIIMNILPQTIEIISKPRVSEITHRYFDNTLLHQAFPSFSFADMKTGIQEMVTERYR